MANQSESATVSTAPGRLPPEATVHDGLCCPLQDMGVLSVRGGDAASFLHGQLSSGIVELQPGDAVLTSYSDARGRVLAVPRVLVESETAFLLVVPADRLAGVERQLTKFVLRADVQIADASATHACLGLAGEPAAKAVAAVAGEPPGQAWRAATLPEGGQLVRLPGERPRWLACAPQDVLSALRAACNGLEDGDGDTWRLLEIEAGMPNVYEATAEHFVAQMLNLDRLGALDFRKGCYPGQEVIARTHYLGRIKRRMHVLDSEDDPAAPGTAVYAAGEKAGEIVAAAPRPGGGSLALAVLRLESAESRLAIGSPDGPVARAAPPPYGLADDA